MSSVAAKWPSEGAIEALVAGRLGDPFAVLGMHAIEGSALVCGFFPGALGVAAIARSDRRPLGALSLAHPDGAFVGELAAAEPYLLQIQWPDALQETEDPYSFRPLLGELDLHLIARGTHYELGRCLGAQAMTVEGVAGVRFAVWAPNARRVSVVGDFNSWDGRRNPMRARAEAGVWEIFMPRLAVGCLYKFEIVGPDGALLPQKADPVARASQAAPGTASIVASSDPFEWTDAAWLEKRAEKQSVDSPISIYEVHAGSWLRVAEDNDRALTWREMAERLVPYVKDMGFTHIEFLPITEYPFGGSWGYQPLGMFAPTGRYGPAEDFAYLVDQCHKAGLGIIVDWVPAHFPTDVWGLARFDGTALYEHQDPREGYHQDWNTLIYNLGRNEVKGFLIASALEWIERYHIDGLRVDAVASMLYRDYSRKQGEWIPNQFGGRENLEAIEFFKHLNSIIAQRCSGVLTIAEESTAWPGVTAPVERGGLGFSLKWNMGWMHDTLHFMEKDPIHRAYHHHLMTFGMVYAYSERFILPLSHDEVVHGKGSLIRKMPGDDWRRFANLRAYLAWMWGFPGKKLIFMGDEIAQWAEWNHDRSLDWDLIDDSRHKGNQLLVADMNRLYAAHSALFATDAEPSAFSWVVADDSENSVFAFVRRGLDNAKVLVIANFTPIPRFGYAIAVDDAGGWEEILNTDAAVYGGGNLGNSGRIVAQADAGGHGRAALTLTLPPLATLILYKEGPAAAPPAT
jgi:1,4-alpha-glucan branching enzyme